MLIDDTVAEIDDRGLVQVPVDIFGKRYKGKIEIYRFMTYECGIYLPKPKSVTVWYMKDILARDRKMVFSKDIQHVNIPYFPGLRVQDLMDFASQYEDVMRVFP